MGYVHVEHSCMENITHGVNDGLCVHVNIYINGHFKCYETKFYINTHTDLM